MKVRETATVDFNRNEITKLLFDAAEKAKPEYEAVGIDFTYDDDGILGTTVTMEKRKK